MSQARKEAVDEADKALVEQAAEVLADYARLPGTEARARELERLLEQLANRQMRLQPENGVTELPKEDKPVSDVGSLPSPKEDKIAPPEQEKQFQPVSRVMPELEGEKK